MVTQNVDGDIVSDEKIHNGKSDGSSRQVESLHNESISNASDNNPDDINDKYILRKLDWKLLPPLILLYLLSFLDRSNVGNAKLEGLTQDLNIGGGEYLSTLTIYFIGYVIVEVPCNIILKRTTPRFWLPTLMLAWGVVATLMGVTQNFPGLLMARFFLGVTESGLFPGVVFYLSMWYKRTETTFRIALFFSAASLAGAFGGVLAWGIGHMRGVGGLEGWRWIFILEGLLTVVVAIAAYGFIHNYPNTAPFLSEPERKFVINRLASKSGGGDANNVEAFSWDGVKQAARDPKCWLYGAAFHTLSLPLYTLSLFLPTIIKALGYTSAQAQLMSVPPYVVATFLTVILATSSERTGCRAPFILGASSLAIVGYVILLSAPVHMPAVSYLGTILAAAGIYPATAIVLAWPANNVSGQTKRATANAMQISIGNLGAVLGTQLYRPTMSPHFYLGHGFAVGYLVANLVVVSTLWWLLSKTNKAKLAQTNGNEVLDHDAVVGSDDDVNWIFQT